MKFKEEKIISFKNMDDAISLEDYYYANSIEELKTIVENEDETKLGFLSARCINSEDSFCMNVGEEGEKIIDWSIFPFYKYLYPWKED